MGFIGRDGKWVIPPKYPGATAFSDGLACVLMKMAPEEIASRKDPFSREFLRGYIDQTGAQVIDFKFTESESFSQGLAAINDVNAGCGYIDKTGAFVIQPQFFMGWNFSEGLARVQTKDGKMAYIDKQGKIAFVVPGVTWADPFSEGLADAALQARPGQRIYGYIDHTGKFVIKPQFQMATPFVNGLAQVTANGEFGYIDKSGTFVWKAKVPSMPGILPPH
jgi:hypothetical protein